MSGFQLSLVGLGAAVVLYWLWKRSTAKSSLPLPPGPKPLPILGNLLDMPMTKQWVTYKDWSYKYGDVCTVTVAGQRLVILNSAEAAFDLLEKRSSIYSSRPTLLFGGELSGWKNGTALMPYDGKFTTHRRLMHVFMGTKGRVKPFIPIVEQSAIRLLLNMIDDQRVDKLEEHIRRGVGAVMLKLVYGYKVPNEGVDPFVQRTDIALAQFSKSCEPGAFLVDTFPFLQYLPDWFPGTGFKQTAKEYWASLSEYAGAPFEFTKAQAKAGNAPNSFVSAQLPSPGSADEDPLKWAAASIVAGGSETTSSLYIHFFLAMMTHPDVQRRAQAEIDKVVGPDRLPTLADEESLPYVAAVVKESQRWQPVAPIVIHSLMQDDTYRGWHIPKDSIIVPNMWHMMHDEYTYKDPFSFNPDRFMGPNPERTPTDFIYGFGRRICPGNILADQSMFIVVARALATLNISKPLDDQGVEIEPVIDHITGLISRPKQFLCSWKPRRETSRSLLQEALSE